MRGLNNLPLDDDIIVRVLRFSPDFATLRAAILTSQSFHNVFKTHLKPILRAVAYNVTGPALPQALRCIRYQLPDTDNSDTENEDPAIGNPVTQHETDERAPITKEETYGLVKNANIIRDFENLFSLRHKDRKFNTSRLNAEESQRFCRAMYRIMLYSRVFPGSRYYEFEGDDDEQEDLATRLETARAERKKFLQDFSTDELYEIHSVSEFLVETVIWVGEDDEEHSFDNDNGDIALACGPEIIHECMQTTSPDPLSDALNYIGVHGDDEYPLISGYLSYPLSKIYEERKVKPPPTDSSRWKSVLDHIEGENDPCAHCSKITGFNLWGRSTSDYLSGETTLFHPYDLPRILKGRLGFSLSDASRLRKEYNDISQDIYCIVEDILESDYKQAEFADKKSEDWLCQECLTKLLKEHLHLWLLDRKRKAGEQIPDNCWHVL
ncbi:hypothetical protein WG66_013039 [Moniliophthora roreri]|uniref:Uncharacterized protein n=1 Tax=Moniliophthora roreri TaxID=221103 RepID=A0A0W0FIJ8_MONRR|nr:hypothetical protein WG66_013039 [Moniliophthora roreri]